MSQSLVWTDDESVQHQGGNNKDDEYILAQAFRQQEGVTAVKHWNFPMGVPLHRSRLSDLPATDADGEKTLSDLYTDLFIRYLSAWSWSPARPWVRSRRRVMKVLGRAWVGAVDPKAQQFPDLMSQRESSFTKRWHRLEKHRAWINENTVSDLEVFTGIPHWSSPRADRSPSGLVNTYSNIIDEYREQRLEGDYDSRMLEGRALGSTFNSDGVYAPVLLLDLLTVSAFLFNTPHQEHRRFVGRVREVYLPLELMFSALAQTTQAHCRDVPGSLYSDRLQRWGYNAERSISEGGEKHVGWIMLVELLHSVCVLLLNYVKHELNVKSGQFSEREVLESWVFLRRFVLDDVEYERNGPKSICSGSDVLRWVDLEMWKDQLADIDKSMWWYGNAKTHKEILLAELDNLGIDKMFRHLKNYVELVSCEILF